MLSALLPLLIAIPGQASEPEPRPNLLLVVADDLGLQLGCYGDRAVPTPSLDRLAEAGTLFEVAYATQSSCSPSRASLLTGLYPHAHGQYGLANPALEFRLHAAVRGSTLPARLAAHGYRTGVLGKVHVDPPAAFPFEARPAIDARDVRAVAEAAGAFFRAGSDPFFLLVSLEDPHAELDESTGRPVWSYPERVHGLPEHPLPPQAFGALPFQGLDDGEQRERIAGYYNAVQRLDAGVGLLLDALADAGRADDTVVVFTSDHGPPFARGKTSCYEAGLRVPLILRWPGVSAPARVARPVSLADVHWTLLDAAGVPTGTSEHGASLRPLLLDPAASWRRYVVGEYHYHGARTFFPRRAIRDERFKLIHNLRAGEALAPVRIDGDDAWDRVQGDAAEHAAARRLLATLRDPPELELYDLEADPHERVNLVEDAEHAATLARLRGALMAWRVRTGDPLLDPEGYARIASYEDGGAPRPRAGKRDAK